MSKKIFPGAIKSVEVDICGTTWTFETGKIAQLAAGTVILRAGGTVVMANVTYGDPQEGYEDLPLVVDYVEKLYAGGLISSSRFVKREGRPSSKEILTARLIDRSIRPLFPKGFTNTVQVIITVLSYDPDFDPRILGINAVSAALGISGLPFHGPIAGLRVGLLKDKLTVYCKNLEIEWPENETDLDLIFTANKDGFVMFDAAANVVSEETIVKGIKMGFDESQKIIAAQEELIKKISPKEIEYELVLPDEELVKSVKEDFGREIEESVLRGAMDTGYFTSNDEILGKVFEAYEGAYSKSAMSSVIGNLRKEVVRDLFIKSQKRIDGRGAEEIRPIDIQTNILPRVHGSALFTRGETQALSVTTLGSLRLEQTLESIEGEDTKRYMHHYNMPPYATGDSGRFMLYPGRREVGHGALAEKALIPVLPSIEEFPYAIRVVSEITQSNGSSSMAATCGSSLSLMDAGVPVKEAVSGIALGLIVDEKSGKHYILSDILGMEDFGGDMDFKVAGTKDGITAIQLDNKRSHISLEIIEEALDQARQGRLHILEEMNKAVSKPRESLSEFAPKIDTLQISKERIGDLIGPGGKNIKSITAYTGVDINVDDDGLVTIASFDEKARQEAIKMVENLTLEIEIGKVYDATVEKIVDFGVFVKLPGNNSGLVHISEITDGFVKDVSSLIKLGQEVKVKVLSRNEEGKINLSIKQANSGAKPYKQESAPKKEQSGKPAK